MARFLKNRKVSKGEAPGTLILKGRKKMDDVRLRVMEYNRKELQEDEPVTFEEIEPCSLRKGVQWINVYGLHDIALMQQMQKQYAIDNLIMEDVLNTDHRPKIEDEGQSICIFMKMIDYDKGQKRIRTEHISIFLTGNTLITFQEKWGDVFDPVRKRLRNSYGKIRTRGADYLMYALLDTIIDNYVDVLESIGAEIEGLGAKVMFDKKDYSVNDIFTYKLEMNYLRKSILPAREMIAALVKNENPLIDMMTKPYIDDLNDHIIQATEALDSYGEMISDHLEIHNSNVSNKANDIMKTLTIFAAIFIPLTYLAGIYGMNFEHMPELSFKFAYPVFWGVSISITVALLIVFYRKKWF